MTGPATTGRGPRCGVVLLAAGEGRRVGAGTNKVLLPLAGAPVFAWSLRSIEALGATEVVLVVREEDRDQVGRALHRHAPPYDLRVVVGGATRHDSEWNALRLLADDIDAGEVDVVAIHDTARPLAGSELFSRVVDAAREHGGALPVRERAGLLHRDPDRGPVAGRLVGVQTPQAFRARPLLEAYRRAGREGFTGTDTASCVEAYVDLEVVCVPAPATNLKVTFPEDLATAGRLLGR